MGALRDDKVYTRSQQGRSESTLRRKTAEKILKLLMNLVEFIKEDPLVNPLVLASKTAKGKEIVKTSPGYGLYGQKDIMHQLRLGVTTNGQLWEEFLNEEGFKRNPEIPLRELTVGKVEHWMEFFDLKEEHCRQALEKLKA